MDSSIKPAFKRLALTIMCHGTYGSYSSQHIGICIFHFKLKYHERLALIIMRNNTYIIVNSLFYMEVYSSRHIGICIFHFSIDTMKAGLLLFVQARAIKVCIHTIRAYHMEFNFYWAAAIAGIDIRTLDYYDTKLRKEPREE